MRKAWTLLVLSVLIAGTGLLFNSQSADASFHIMRIYGVMGGANGDANIQFVELRMPDPGQNLLFLGSGGTAVLCFFDAGGLPYARFKFPSDVANGADEASILIGTSEFDSNWAAGSPDFTFSGANTTAIAGGADVLHPVRSPAGKAGFGTDSAAVPSMMCALGFSAIDTIAHGTGYTGTANFGTRFNQDLPTSGVQSAKVQGPAPTNPANGSLCFPGSFFSNCSVARNNSVDYALVSTNTAGNNPRNNANQTGPVALADADGDGIGDASDLCPGTVPASPVDANGCSQAQVDGDLDGFCNPSAPSGGPGPCTGTDNCPSMTNPDQANFDGDATGDACDPDIDGDGTPNGSDSEADGDLIPNTAETTCGSDPNDSLRRPERIDGVFAGVDDDGDTAIDEALPGGAANFDCDGDGYTGEAEGGTPLCGNAKNDDDKVGVALVADDAVIDDGCPGGPAQVGTFSEAQFNIGLGDQDPCGLNGWPSDFVTGGIPVSTNKINVLDLTSFIAPVALKRLNTAPGQPTFDKRWDLSPGRGVFTPMINVTDLTALIAASSGFPPMLAGAKAFNGPSCPWPP